MERRPEPNQTEQAIGPTTVSPRSCLGPETDPCLTIWVEY
jgi:hypothetical protein